MGLDNPRLLLHLEGAVLFIIGILAYWHIGGNWFFFAATLLVPDLSALGYLANPVIGARAYNLFHLPLWPAIFVLVGWFGASMFPLSVGLIWFCHIGMDRAAGFGFKYPTEFKATHMQRV